MKTSCSSIVISDLRCCSKGIAAPRRGFLLLSVLITLLVLSLIGASLHRMTLTAMRTAERNLTQRHLVLACETGADMAVSDLRAAGLFAGAVESAVTGYLTANNRGWTSSGGNLFKTVSLPGRRGLTAVKVKFTGQSGSSPVAYVQAENIDGSIWRQMAVFFEKKNQSGGGYGFVALRRLRAVENGDNHGGDGVLIADSYDSSQGPYNAAYRKAGAIIGSASTSANNLALGKKVSIFGKIAFPGDSSGVGVGLSKGRGVTAGINSDAKVSATPLDDAAMPAVDANGDGKLDNPAIFSAEKQDANSFLQKFSPPSTTSASELTVDANKQLCSGGTSLPVRNGKVKIPAGVYRVTGELNLPDGYEIEIDGAVNLVFISSNSRFQIPGDGTIDVKDTGSLTMYSDAVQFNWSGNTTINAATPSQVRFISTVSAPTSQYYRQQLNLSGNTIWNAVVYAPYTQVNLSGNTTLYGSLIGGDILCSGNTYFHFDESLAGGGSSSAVTVALVTELTGADRVARF